jgi:hypothetical protein
MLWSLSHLNKTVREGNLAADEGDKPGSTSGHMQGIFESLISLVERPGAALTGVVPEDFVGGSPAKLADKKGETWGFCQVFSWVQVL